MARINQKFRKKLEESYTDHLGYPPHLSTAHIPTVLGVRRRAVVIAGRMRLTRGEEEAVRQVQATIGLYNR